MACQGAVASWGVMHMPWAQLEWDEEVTIERVVLYDRVSPEEHLAGGTLRFSDGSEVSVTGIPNDGSPRSVTFTPRKVKWMRFEATDGAGKNIGLSEIEVFPARDERTSYVEWVDPWIETTRGRWFFCTPAARPMGMWRRTPSPATRTRAAAVTTTTSPTSWDSHRSTTGWLPGQRHARRGRRGPDAGA